MVADHDRGFWPTWGAIDSWKSVRRFIPHGRDNGTGEPQRSRQQLSQPKYMRRGVRHVILTTVELVIQPCLTSLKRINISTYHLRILADSIHT